MNVKDWCFKSFFSVDCYWKVSNEAKYCSLLKNILKKVLWEFTFTEGFISSFFTKLIFVNWASDSRKFFPMKWIHWPQILLYMQLWFIFNVSDFHDFSSFCEKSLYDLKNCKREKIFTCFLLCLCERIFSGLFFLKCKIFAIWIKNSLNLLSFR